MVVDFNVRASKVLSPTKLAHIVLRTNKFKEMVPFYQQFLGAEVIYENEYLAFISYDEEHHRIAIVGISETKNKDRNTCGLEHIAFSFNSVSDLLLAYRQRKERGMTPIWPVNHGPTTSIYYKDPDGNMIETQVDNFDDPEEATAFMRSPFFAENSIGTDFDPEDYIKRLASGESEDSLKKRVEVGPRGLPEFF